ncbi:MAG: hypothetical protein SPK72_00270 [Bacteroidales bacterium]|jgi:hypothetical protein|nr:hypothetical protein [Bacteroidales bacterium]
MKKVALLLALAFTLGVVFTSCRQSKSCPAYGEHQQYQRENVY